MSHKLGRRARRRLNPGPAKPTGLLIEAGVETGKDLALVLLLGLVMTIPALIAFFFDVFDNGAHFLLVFAMLWAVGVTSCLTISHPNKRAGGVIRALCGVVEGVTVALLIDAGLGGVMLGAVLCALLAWSMPYGRSQYIY
jgi:hypothetical protein